MLFLKNLLLRNFQGCCLLFNYQGSSLFLLIRSSFDILSHRFLFVKNFFHFLFAVCSGSVSPSQVSFNRLSHRLLFVKNFFSLCTAICSRILSHSGPWAYSFHRSVSATSGILSREKWIVNVFSVFYFFRTIQTIHFCFYLRYHAAHILSFISPNTKQQPSKTLHILTLLHHK